MRMSTDISTRDAIIEALQPYLDGARSGRGATMAASFHPDATVFGHIGADLFAGPIQQLFDWNDANGPAADLEATVAAVDIAGTVATVRLELANWTGRQFTDLFTLLNVDDEWKIMNKVFHLHANP